MSHFLKTTIVGGAFFLVPFVLILVILGYALNYTALVAGPISNGLGLNRLGEWLGIGAATLVAALVLVIVSFTAGILAGTRFGKRARKWLEDSLLSNLPHYQQIKETAELLANVEKSDSVKPALINVGDSWQLGYVIEPLENGWLAVLVPEAPAPMSGNVTYCPPEQVRMLDITVTQAMSIVRNVGAGSREILRGIDLAGARTA